MKLYLSLLVAGEGLAPLIGCVGGVIGTHLITDFPQPATNTILDAVLTASDEAETDRCKGNAATSGVHRRVNR